VVTSAGSPEFPAPPLAVEANRLVMPYIRLVHLTSAYRFFARNPGPTDLLWFRLRFQSGRVRWVEWPDADARWLGVQQRRDLATGLALRSHLTRPAPGARWPTLNAPGEACVSSFVRFLGRTEAEESGDPVASVQAFLVAHRILIPYEIQMGWGYTDLRLYQPIVPLGTYDRSGRRVTSSPDEAESVAGSPSVFARWVIEQDVRTGAGRSAVPRPIRDLLARFPALDAPGASADALRAEIERLILAGDTPERIRDPARRAFEISLRTPKGRGGT
jgi:hypothetical protein